MDTVDISTLKRITIEELVTKTETVENDNTIGGITGQITNSRMLIPYNNGVFEQLGFTVTKNNDNVTLKDDNYEVVIGFYDDFFTLNGESVECEVPQQYIDDVLYIPVRAVAESFGATVDWSEETKTASVTYGTKVTELVYSVPLKVQVMESYMDVISREGNGGDVRYCLYDFDGDGISELVAYNSESCVVCTYVNEELSDYTGNVDFSLISERHKAEDYEYMRNTLSNISDDSVVYLTPTEQDFQDLEDELNGDYICHWEYDFKNTFDSSVSYTYYSLTDTTVAINMVVSYLRDRVNFYGEYGDYVEKVEYRYTVDGDKRIANLKIDADFMDNLLINKFNLKIDRDKFNNLYYSDGYYYGMSEANGGYSVYEINSYESVGNGMYLVEGVEKGNYSGGENVRIDESLLVALKKVDGKKMWSYYVISQENALPINPSDYVDLRDFAYIDWKYKVDGGYIYFEYNIGNTVAVTGADETVTNVTIPSAYKGMTVSIIRPSAFNGCQNLTDIRLPNTIEDIGYYAFDGCSSLKSIELPDSLGYLGDYTFYGCKSLTEIKLPNTITDLGVSVFEGCSSLKSIEIPDGVEYLSPSAFNGCSSLTEIIAKKGSVYEDYAKECGITFTEKE